ncbi:hypothetical protein HAX54_002565, partial [Datura stramonium]|nr:hypothetical protein [Datura stramonium]
RGALEAEFQKNQAGALAGATRQALQTYRPYILPKFHDFEEELSSPNISNHKFLQ